MDYFVNIEYTPYYQWQAEILIESFKQHKLEENLVVSVAATDSPPKVEFCRNLSVHSRTHIHANIGEIRGYDRMNRLFGITNLLNQGMLKQPFVALESDCVLYKPLEIIPREVPHIIFQSNPFFTEQMVKDRVPNLDKYLSKSWVPLGGIVYFNNIPQLVFERAILLTEMLAYEQVKNDMEIWKYTDRVAWAINIGDLLGQALIEGIYTMEMPLNDYQNEFNFISYERGVYPHFSKAMFMYEPPTMLSLGDPLHVLANLNETVATATIEYVGNLAKKCLAAQNATN